MKKFALALSLLMLASSAVFAGPIQKEQIPAGVKWVAHADVETMVKSQMGQFLLKKANAEGLQEKMNEFSKTFGFDPVKDLKSVTAFGTDFTEETGLLSFTGAFNKDTIVTLLQANPTFKASKYGELDMYQWGDTDKKSGKAIILYGCFYGNTMALVSRSEEMVKLAVDTLGKKKDSLAKVDTLPSLGKAEAGAFIVAAGEDFPANPNDPGSAAIVKKVQAANIQFGETDKSVFARVTMTTRTAKDANEINSILQGLLAMGAMFGAEQPEGQKDPVQAKVVEFLQQIKITAAGTTVAISADWDIAAVQAFVDTAMEMKKAGEKRGHGEGAATTRKTRKAPKTE